MSAFVQAAEPAKDEYKATFKITMTQTSAHPYGVGATKFAELIKERTNGRIQAKVFNEATELTGVILTKLEGTAKGGFAISIKTELGVPVRWVGLGETQADFALFDAQAYAHALLNEK